MSWFGRLFGRDDVFTSSFNPGGARILDIPSGENVRELGGYQAFGGTTRYGRYLRAGSTEGLVEKDLRLFERYGVKYVLDLRGDFEHPAMTCRFARRKGITWLNVPLFGYDLSDPKLNRSRTIADGFTDYLTESYLTMLANRDAVRQIIEFLARVPEGDCALFHCAAGMDRTGVTSMLVLGVAGVGRRQILADYTYSFGTIDEVNRAIDDPSYDGESPWNSIQARLFTISTVYDTLIEAYGTVREYLIACGVSREDLDLLRSGFVQS